MRKILHWLSYGSCQTKTSVFPFLIEVFNRYESGSRFGVTTLLEILLPICVSKLYEGCEKWWKEPLVIAFMAKDFS